MAGQLGALKARYDQALEARKKTELQIEAFRPVRQQLDPQPLYTPNISVRG